MRAELIEAKLSDLDGRPLMLAQHNARIGQALKWLGLVCAQVAAFDHGMRPVLNRPCAAEMAGRQSSTRRQRLRFHSTFSAWLMCAKSA